MDLFVCGFGCCWLALVISGCQPSIPRHQAFLLHSVKRVMGKRECEADHGLMLAHALAGPTVEQQGEMARSGGRMLATLEPEQVRTFTDSLVGFRNKAC